MKDKISWEEWEGFLALSDDERMKEAEAEQVEVDYPPTIAKEESRKEQYGLSLAPSHFTALCSLSSSLQRNHDEARGLPLPVARIVNCKLEGGHSV
jgi:hypothetical protein